MIFAVALAPILSGAQKTCFAKEPNFAQEARSFWHFAFDYRSRRIPSPDGKKAVVLRTIGKPEADNVALDVTIGPKRLNNILSDFSSVEVLWSPDSHYVAITTTGEGGDMLGTELVILSIDGEKVRTLSPHKSLVSTLPRKLDCAGFAVTSAIAWKDNQTLIASVGPPWCSVCGVMEVFDAFEVHLPSGTLGRHYTQIEAKREFRGKLGCLLRTTDDGSYKELLAARTSTTKK